LDIKTFIYCDISGENMEKSEEAIHSLRNNKGIKLELPENIFGLKISHEKWPFRENSLHCIVNNFYLHNVNNSEELFLKYNESLKPDGCFIGTLA
jgi:SAM-dependent methyltransferase